MVEKFGRNVMPRAAAVHSCAAADRIPAAMTDPAADASDPLVGRVVADGRYEILGVLGRGGMGTVYRARQLPLDRVVVLKLIHRAMAAEAGALARFQREMKVTVAIEHPNTVRVYDFGDIDGQPFLAMEFLSGRTVRDVLRSDGYFAPPRLAAVGIGVANGLGAAHAAGIVHRDLKPDNVMLVDAYGQPDFVKVLDFGIARLPEGDAGFKTMTGVLMGTPTYMSPEQASGVPIDGRSDFYALGVMLYEMATGWPPFTGTSLPALLMAHAHAPPPPLAERLPDLPPGIEALIMRLLAKSPADRPADAVEVARALAPFAGGAVAQAAAAPPPRASVPRAPAWGGGATTGAGGTISAGSGEAFASRPALWGPPEPSGPLPPVTPPGPRGRASAPTEALPAAEAAGGGSRRAREEAHGAKGSATARAPARPRSRMPLALAGLGAVAIAAVVGGAAWLYGGGPHGQPPGGKDIVPPRAGGESGGGVRPPSAAAGEPEWPASCAAGDARLLDEARAQLATDAAAAGAAAARAVAACPSSAVARYLEGSALQKQKQLGPAEAAYREAVRLAPDFTAPRFNLALVALGHGATAEALEALDALASTHPELPNLFLVRAEAHRRGGDAPAALADLEEQVKRQPDGADGWYQLGRARAARKRPGATDAFCRAKALGHAEAAPLCER
jgi:serine/threonine-protein kinase